MSLPELRERPLQRWTLVQSVLWLPILLLLPLQLGSGRLAELTSGELSPQEIALRWIPLALMLISYGGLWFTLRAGRTLADWVTLARFAGLIGFVILINLAGQVTWIAWILALVVILGDLVDGYVARRFGSSPGGAVLDMETDQFSTLALAIVAATLMDAGYWTLALPAFKYMFVLAMTLMSIKSTDPKPCDGDNQRGRLICAIVLGLLLASIFPAFSATIRGTASAAAVLLLAYSFSSDAAFLWRAAREISAPS
ncbi:MAG: phosphatidylglycerophosphate synthase [Planctomycetota bacterium]|jgi:phosphatidylglycerophosphate synthase